MVAIPVRLDKNNHLMVAADRRIYLGTSQASPTFANGYRRRKTGLVSRSFIPATASGGTYITRFSYAHDDLRTVANGGYLQTGNDFKFTNTNDVNIDFEVDTYDPVEGRIHGTFRFTGASNVNFNRIRLYFDNPDISASQENRAGLRASYYATWNLPSKVDFTGNLHDLDSDAIAATGAFGIHGNAAGFNSTIARIRTTSPAFMNGKSNFAISMMVRLASTAADRVILSIGDAPSDLHIHYKATAQTDGTVNYLEVRARGSSTSTVVRTAGDLFTDGQLFHLLVVFPTTGICLVYVNGVLMATGNNQINAFGALFTAATALTIGGGTPYFQGQIDSVQIHNVIPTAATVLYFARNLKYYADMVQFGETELPGQANPVAEAVFIQTTGAPVDIKADDYIYMPSSGTPRIDGWGSPLHGTINRLSDNTIRYSPASTYGGDDVFLLTFEVV